MVCRTISTVALNQQITGRTAAGDSSAQSLAWNDPSPRWTAAAYSQAQPPAWNVPSTYDESFFIEDVDDDMHEDASE